MTAPRARPPLTPPAGPAGSDPALAPAQPSAWAGEQAPGPRPAVIRSLATALPEFYATASEVYEFVTRRFDLSADERELYRRLLLEGPIRGRPLAADDLEEVCRMTADEQTQRFARRALELARRAGAEALRQAGVRAEDVGGLVVNTCTGYLCPGLSSYVAQELGLGRDLRVLDLMGMGCGAAIPNLQAGAGLLALGGASDRPVLCIAVEICSATLFMGPQHDLIVSNCLFSDAAGAAVLESGEAQGGDLTAGPGAAPRAGLCRLIDFESGLFPQHREDLRYRCEDGRLRNVLSRRVPVLAGRAVGEVARRLLARRGLGAADVDWWAVHPGGTVVLEQVAGELGLARADLRFSHDVLERWGNMSSPSVLFVLRQVLDRGRPRRGQRGLLLAFGAGFTAFAALVEFA